MDVYMDMNRPISEEEKQVLRELCNSDILSGFSFLDFWKVLAVFSHIIEDIEAEA